MQRVALRGDESVLSSLVVPYACAMDPPEWLRRFHSFGERFLPVGLLVLFGILVLGWVGVEGWLFRVAGGLILVIGYGLALWRWTRE